MVRLSYDQKGKHLGELRKQDKPLTKIRIIEKVNDCCTIPRVH